MSFEMAKLNRLRSMRLNEMIGRGRQEFAKLADRFLIPGAGEVSDKSLYHEFKMTARNGSGGGAAEMLRDRLRTGSWLFPASLTERKTIVEIMGSRFPGDRDAIIASAEKSISGRLDLLGFTDLDFGHPVDW